MNDSRSKENRSNREAKNVQVPRDRDTDEQPATNAGSPQPAAMTNMPDEGYTDQDKPLVAGSAEAKALHARPPKTKGTLGVGTAGDAARPSKPGMHNKPIPPRGKM